jgi:inward rectifier potassium channel
MAVTQEPKDLGFGSVVASQSRVRLMNRDGSFNVQRGGRLAAIIGNPYHSLLTISWPAFLGVLAIVYILANIGFAFLFLLCGPRALGETDTAFAAGSFLQAFFFSVETFATIGYGAIVPMTVRSNFLVLLESFVSLISIALATGLIFARFSRPIPHIRFSARAVIAPYQGRTGFMFRIANARRNEIVGIEATVIMARFTLVNGTRTRTFTELALERKRVIFFSLSWTVVHPVDETSPIWGLTSEQLMESEAEFLILLSGTDETFFQTVSARGSYTAAEVLWGHKFTNVFLPPTREGIVRIDLALLDATEPTELPEAESRK